MKFVVLTVLTMTIMVGACYSIPQHDPTRPTFQLDGRHWYGARNYVEVQMEPVDWKAKLEEEKAKFKWEQERQDRESMQKTAEIGRWSFIAGLAGVVAGVVLFVFLKQYNMPIIGTAIAVLGVIAVSFGLVAMKVAHHWHVTTTGGAVIVIIIIAACLVREFDIINWWRAKKSSKGKTDERLD